MIQASVPDPEPTEPVLASHQQLLTHREKLNVFGKALYGGALQTVNKSA